MDAKIQVMVLIYKLALKVFPGHVWYLSDTLIGLAFFDNRVSDNVKVKIVKSLDKKLN